MSDEHGNGNVARYRLEQLEKDVTEIKRTVREMREFQVAHPLCPQPGKCLDLENRMVTCQKHIERDMAGVKRDVDVIKSRVLLGMGILIVVGLVVPELIRHFLNGH